MKNITDAKCTDISFQISDWVFLKLQPYRHWSLTGQSTHKLSRRFFSPFEILEKTGKVAYRLALPATAQLHDVFHVSKLKHCHVDPSIQQLPFLVTFHNDQLIYKPIEILKNLALYFKATTLLANIWFAGKTTLQQKLLGQPKMTFAGNSLPFTLRTRWLSKGRPMYQSKIARSMVWWPLRGPESKIQLVWQRFERGRLGATAWRQMSRNSITLLCKVAWELP